MSDRPRYAVYNKHCGHVINIHGDRAVNEPIIEAIQPANGYALRTRKATDVDLEALVRGDRCERCTLDGQTTEVARDGA
jgi:hypothetical protein